MTENDVKKALAFTISNKTHWCVFRLFFAKSTTFEDFLPCAVVVHAFILSGWNCLVHESVIGWVVNVVT